MSVFSVEPNERVKFRILHEDEHLLVVDKPSQLVTQPGLGHDYNSLLNGLFAKFGNKLQKLGRDRDFGLLHRLDKETSGLLIVALMPDAYDGLRKAFEDRAIRKYYWAISSQTPSSPSGVIRRPIAEAGGEGQRRAPSNRRDRSNTAENAGKKLARVAASGRPAVTAFRVIESSPLACLLECRAVTGRLHQVRVHLESIGCPILGDDLYAPEAVRKAGPRLALHAHRLVFEHPVTGATIDVESPWPPDLRKILTRLRLKRPESPARGVSAVPAGEAEID
jgi:23S rRNA pseudouridine1911/1915/1917 synthase